MLLSSAMSVPVESADAGRQNPRLRPAWIDGDDHDLVGIGHLSA
jgi:hypothetical protein